MRKIAIYDEDKRGGMIVVDAFSGGSWMVAKNTFFPNTTSDGNIEMPKTYKEMNGPTIPGRYLISDPFNNKHEWFSLLNPGDFSMEYEYGRYGFYLHLGSGSNGCITVNKYDAKSKTGWLYIVQMILSTKPKYYQKSGGDINFSGCIRIYGEITVE